MDQTEGATDLLLAALAQLAEGVIITAPGGEILYVNDAAHRIHGVAELGVGTEDYSETYSLFREDGTPYPSEELPLARTVQTGEVIEGARWMIRRPDMTEVRAVGTSGPVMAEDGTRLGSVLTLRDETEQQRQRAALDQAMETQRMLLHEVNHRVANSLGLLISLVRFQARAVTDEGARQALAQVEGRMRVMASIHTALYRNSEDATVEARSYFKTMAEDVVRAFAGTTRVAVTCDAPEGCTLPLNVAIPLALMVNEMMTNSLKYAFGDRPDGSIRIMIDGPSTVERLVYSDDGRGLPPDYDPATAMRGSGVGTTIIATLTRQLRAELVAGDAAPGARFEIRLPAPA